MVPAIGILHILHIKHKEIGQYSFSIFQVRSLLHLSSQLKEKGTSHFAFCFPFSDIGCNKLRRALLQHMLYLLSQEADISSLIGSCLPV